MSTDSPVLEVPALPTIKLTEQTLRSNDGLEYTFPVCEVNSPDQWEAASKRQREVTIKVPGAGRKLSFEARGLSYKEWVEIEERWNYPDNPLESQAMMVKSPLEIEKAKIAFNQVSEKILSHRHIEVFELTTGKVIPGDSFEEKHARLQQLNYGEMDALFTQIFEHLSGLTEGPDVAQYEELREKTVVPINDFSDWLSTSKSEIIYVTQRSFDSYLLIFPLKQITKEQRKIIEDECYVSPPHGKHTKVPGSQTMSMQYDYNNPDYLQRRDLADKKRRILLLEACLPFKLPGDTQDEKYTWLNGRLLGDVLKVSNFIMKQLTDYTSRLDFFQDA